MQPMSFGGVYSYTFWLIRQTLGPTMLAVVILAVFSILFGYGFSTSFHSLTEFVGTLPASGGPMDEAAQERMGRAFLGWIMPIFATGIVFFLAFRFTQILATSAGWDAATGDQRSIGELAGASFGRPLWMSVAQTILVGVLWIAVSMVFGIIMGVAGGASGSSAFSAILGYILQGLQIWFSIATITTIPLITVEDRGPWKSLVASLALGRGYWWRNFALFIVPGLLLGIISILLVIASIGELSPSLLSAFESPSDPNDPMMAMTRLQTLMGFIAPTITVMMVIGAVITPFFYHLTTAIYIDLRARRGDFMVEGEDDDAPAPTDPTISW